MRFLLFLFLLIGLAAGLRAQSEESRTVIESDELVMQGEEDRNTFLFTGNVYVFNENLTLTSDRLEVVSNRLGDPDATVGEIGVIESVVAVGNVTIKQGDRSAFAGRAEVDPKKGQVILSDKPRIVDRQAEVSGWKIVLNRGEKSAQVIPNPNRTPGSNQQEGRSKVVLTDDLPELNYENIGETQKKEKTGEQERPAPLAPQPKADEDSKPAPIAPGARDREEAAQ